MSLTRKVKPEVAASFIAAAPDAGAVAPAAAAPAAETERVKKTAISLTLRPELLAAVDAIAAKRGISRAAAISTAVSRYVESE